MVAKPSARLNVVTLPDPCPIGYAASDVPAASSAVSTNPTSRYSVRPISLLTLTANRAGTTVRSCEPATGQQAKHRRHELVKREDRRRRKAGEHDDGTATSRREADRFARLERDAVRHDSGIAQFGDDAIRQIARSLARATREQHDIGKLEGLLQAFPAGRPHRRARSPAASARRPARARHRRAPGRSSRRPSRVASARRER